MTSHHFDDETLMAYADGELDEATSTMVADAEARDPAVAGRIAQFRQTRQLASTVFGGKQAAPVPDALAKSIQAMLAKSKSRPKDSATETNAADNVVSFQQRKPAADQRSATSGKWAVPIAAGIALLAGGIGGFFAGSGFQEEFASNVQMASIDTPGLSEALDAVASGNEIEIGDGKDRFKAIASFRNWDQAFCREFELDRANGSSIVAVACKPEKTWDIQFTVVAGQADSGYAPASSLEVLDAYISSSGSGEPMSAEEEKALLAKPAG